MPRAATSVATSACELALGEVRQRTLAQVLAQVAVDGRAPRRRASSSLSASRSAPCLVAENTRCARHPAMIAAATLTLSISCTGEEPVRHLLDGHALGRRPRGVTGSSGSAGPGCRRPRRGWPRTAASGAFPRRCAGSTRPGAGTPCRPCGRPRRSRPCDTSATERSPRSIRSIARPGVHTARSTPPLEGLDLLLDRVAAVDRGDADAAGVRQRQSARRAPGWRAHGSAPGRCRSGGPAWPSAGSAAAADRRRGSCRSRSWPSRRRRDRRGCRGWSSPGWGTRVVMPRLGEGVGEVVVHTEFVESCHVHFRIVVRHPGYRCGGGDPKSVSPTPLAAVDDWERRRRRGGGRP